MALCGVPIQCGARVARTTNSKWALKHFINGYIHTRKRQFRIQHGKPTFSASALSVAASRMRRAALISFMARFTPCGSAQLVAVAGLAAVSDGERRHRVFPSEAHLATVKCERQPVSRAEQQNKLCANALTPHTPHTLHIHIHTPRHTRMYRCWPCIGPAIATGKMLHTDTKINRLTVNAHRIRVDVCDKCLVDGEPKRLHCFAQLLLHSQGNLYNSPRDSDDQNAARDV